MDSSILPHFACVIKKKNSKRQIVENRIQMRRGSSLSNLDKVIQTMPDLVRCTTADQQLYVSSDDHLQKSPNMSRSLRASSNALSTGGSFGDLMNMKQFGSSQWSVRSDSLIAKTLPLSTVTPKPIVTEEILLEDVTNGTSTFQERCVVDESSLTAAQRTLKLAKLIQQQRGYKDNRIHRIPKRKPCLADNLNNGSECVDLPNETPTKCRISKTRKPSLHSRRCAIHVIQL
ncbi:unnamed protein product [Psylliodes chrysocephalus]|uniref:Uncharacterized protein n=1 Tax=Psylliodes chrysocephalus TaxID=3402493 RepID=A0A9P0G4M9_9CUCU|nr:unnamed protein product [Psylliodes chrysocephala]